MGGSQLDLVFCVYVLNRITFCRPISRKAPSGLYYIRNLVVVLIKLKENIPSNGGKLGDNSDLLHFTQFPSTDFNKHICMIFAKGTDIKSGLAYFLLKV